MFQGLLKNKSIRYLNLSNNCLNSNDKEFGARIGRLLQVKTTLAHLDIRACHLTREEVLFVVLCLRESLSLMSIHLGFNYIN